MERNLKHMLSGAGFYTALAGCLCIVAVGGYFLLFDGEDPAPQQSQEQKESVETVAPVQEVAQTPEEDLAEETFEPTVQEEPEPVMPEVEIDDTPVVAQAPRLTVSPLNGDIVAAFSVDSLVYSETLGDWRTHDGIDIAAKPGTTVLAASSGTVLAVTDDVLMGTTVVIEHDGGYQTTYANLQQRPNVAEGDTVSAGQIIGAVGTTAAAEAAQAPHLHFSVSKDGDVVDPEAFLNR